MQRAAWASGVTEGTRGPLRPCPGGRRSQAPGVRGAAGAGALLLPPGPHLSGHPPRSPWRVGGSGLGRGPACARPPHTFAPPSLAAGRGRGRGRGRVRSGPEGRRSASPRLLATSVRLSTGAVGGGAHPAPSCVPQIGLLRVTQQEPLGIWIDESTTARPQALGAGGVRLVSRRREPGWGPGSRHQRRRLEAA